MTTFGAKLYRGNVPKQRERGGRLHPTQYDNAATRRMGPPESIIKMILKNLRLAL